MTKRTILLGLSLVLLLGGCTRPRALTLQRLDPKVPGSAGLPAAPALDQPAPLTQRPPFGLYANSPTPDTLAKLSVGTLSPDGRYRAAMTDQGAWIARVDAAWLWEIKLPAPPPPVPNAGTQIPGAQPATPPGTPTAPGNAAKPAPPVATKIVEPLTWTPRNTLLFHDDIGTMLEANPDTAQVTPLPAALQNKQILSFSPNGKQVLYYTPGKTGQQLWVANFDGTNAKLLGENVTAAWSQTNQLTVTKIVPLVPVHPDQAAP